MLSAVYRVLQLISWGLLVNHGAQPLCCAHKKRMNEDFRAMKILVFQILECLTEYYNIPQP